MVGLSDLCLYSAHSSAKTKAKAKLMTIAHPKKTIPAMTTTSATVAIIAAAAAANATGDVAAADAAAKKVKTNHSFPILAPLRRG